MKIIAISGSLRPSSTNTALLHAVAKLAPKDLDLTIYNGLADLPHFTPELDGDTLPRVVKDWRALLEKSDGVLISTPEYAYGIPGVLKNALDWIVPSGELVDKPVATISASPSELGGSKAHASLMLTLTALAANLVEGGSVTIPFVSKKLNANGELIDINTVQSLKFLLDALVRAIIDNRK
ncbi:flavoprotein [Nostoc sp. 'Peltigera membranacea cyanobiont' 210A]|uniref:NADPH-dependent FMN reductase n=1 Tax=Nostoc sp. 'Peltigera membranacea cyanobiont' 210A TaxID=2014529 RepID=UPI000B95A860|nr:NADPH-dependent FMN reductase [Nostoc sp. 'Peltigera membranacea cyanobiont' 210A]OYD96392.1 flavoprotein [Nostoc sp. 'Peltigera membranacea cyanobiont' 210A]